MSIFYRVIEHCENSHHEAPPCSQGLSYGVTEMEARECAQDYWDNHDGWEASWPLTFVLHDGEGGPELGRFFVDMEARPSFTAARKEQT